MVVMAVVMRVVLLDGVTQLCSGGLRQSAEATRSGAWLSRAGLRAAPATRLGRRELQLSPLSQIMSRCALAEGRVYVSIPLLLLRSTRRSPQSCV
ncbi:hypothetical protein B0J12DRAFT_62663 [Macrophomina phaseolina]|uniref:Secreted protein n=1 Tax=Macrophomina phaseolina TaxID=35725 RepID=A0ABQ8GCL0_9PEZI|nr:hypothetical protein B0J12DRAFT_62663 [Macrophomina phaseolina]